MLVGWLNDPDSVLRRLWGDGWRHPAGRYLLCRLRLPRTYPAVGAPCRIPTASAFPCRSGFQHVPRGGVSSSRPNGARMPAAIGFECFPRILEYRRSYWLLRHPRGMPANVGWRWIGRAVASRLLMRIGGGVLLSTPPATTSGHSAMNVRGWCSQCCLQMRGVLRGTACGLPPPHLLAVMGLDVK